MTIERFSPNFTVGAMLLRTDATDIGWVRNTDHEDVVRERCQELRDESDRYMEAARERMEELRHAQRAHEAIVSALEAKIEENARAFDAHQERVALERDARLSALRAQLSRLWLGVESAIKVTGALDVDYLLDRLKAALAAAKDPDRMEIELLSKDRLQLAKDKRKLQELLTETESDCEELNIARLGERRRGDRLAEELSQVKAENERLEAEQRTKMHKMACALLDAADRCAVEARLSGGCGRGWSNDSDRLRAVVKECWGDTDPRESE